MLKSGDILVGRYRIQRLIARGGMGAVYEARDESLRRSIALKETLISEKRLPRAFLNEATLLANLNHPVLPAVFDHFSEGDGQYITMEYIPGDDLGKLLDERNQPFPVSEVESWYSQLLDALDYLHAHTIIHRDLKPANLKVKSDGRIILLDFGLAKGMAGHMSHAAGHSIHGFTPVYAPPEQISGEATTVASDLYSLGATMYHLLTNTPPIDAHQRELKLLKTGRDPLRPLAEVRPEVPSRLADMLTQALELDPRDRPASASAMKLTAQRRIWPSAQSVEPDEDLDRSKAPTVLIAQETVLINPTTIPTEEHPAPPASPLSKPANNLAKRAVRLRVAVPAALALLLIAWFVITHNPWSRTSVSATNIVPLTDENRSLYGGIEIGAKGVKGIVMKIDLSPNGFDPKALMPLKSINTTIMAGVAQTGKFSPEAIDDTAKAVRSLYTQMQDDYKVATVRIRIIGSSGLEKPNKFAVDNKDELARKIESVTGNKMTFLNVEQEVRDSIVGTIPENFLDTATLVDIGSGNTKGGYQAEGQFVTMNVPYGTVSFTDEISKQSGTAETFAQKAERLRNEILVPALRQQMDRRPGLEGRPRVYLTGGIVWAMVTLLRPTDREPYVKITAADIDTFARLALSGDKSLRDPPPLTGIEDSKKRQEIEGERKQIKDIFGPPNLIAGAELLQAVYSEYKLADKEVFFFRDESKGWGWLMAYIKDEAAAEKKK